jgi:hypothetical protein
VKFCRNSFLYIQQELIFPSKGGLGPSKRGQKPPFEENKGVPAKCTTPKRPDQVFLWYQLVKYRENTDRYQTEIPNQDATL